ncbi:MAG: hypothetical protein GTN81_06385 [Proteobacteria bacterium]|nr:hypothetical protein [Pseudomonadota bacterium]
MIKSLTLLGFTTTLILLGGCRDQLIRETIDAASIPDQSYSVMIYGATSSRYYAVVLDIPDDDVEVTLQETSFTKKAGRGSPREYMKEFDSRMGRYVTLSISDADGRVRGYLLVSYYLKHWTRQAGEKIIVTVTPDESYLGYP